MQSPETESTDRWHRKFDALVAAVMELDDVVRDLILSRAKQLEFQADDDALDDDAETGL